MDQYKVFAWHRHQNVTVLQCVSEQISGTGGGIWLRILYQSYFEYLVATGAHEGGTCCQHAKQLAVNLQDLATTLCEGKELIYFQPPPLPISTCSATRPCDTRLPRKDVEPVICTSREIVFPPPRINTVFCASSHYQ
jgi:hypothetical protein